MPWLARSRLKGEMMAREKSPYEIAHNNLELLVKFTGLQADIFIHGCTPTRRKRIWKLGTQLLEHLNIPVTDEYIRMIWYEG